MNLPLAADPTTLLAALAGRVHTAARLLGYTRALYDRLNFHKPDVTVTYLARIDALLREELDDRALEPLAAEGAAWSDDDAFRAAFETTDD